MSRLRTFSALVACALAAMAVGCTKESGESKAEPATPPAESATSSVEIDRDGGGEAHVEGLKVSIAPGGLSKSASLVVTRTRDAPALPADPDAAVGIDRAASAYELDLSDGATLAKPATLTFSVPPNTSEGMVLAAGYYDETSDRWIVADGEVSEDGTQLTVVTDHFSLWTAFLGNLVSVTSGLSARILEQGDPEAAAPTCAGEAADRVADLTSGASDPPIDFCLEEAHGQTVVRVTNRRGYDTAALVPAGVTFATTSGGSLAENLAIGFNRGVANRKFVVPAGFSADLAIGAEAPDAFEIIFVPDPATALFSALLAGIDLYFGGKPPAEAAAMIADAADCLLSITSTFEADPLSIAGSAGSCVKALVESATVAMAITILGVVKLVPTLLAGAADTATGSGRAVLSVATRATDPCTPDRIAADLPDDLNDYVEIVEGCIDGWAYVDLCEPNPGGCDSLAIVRHDRAAWSLYVGFPTEKCYDDAAADGVPDELLDRFQACTDDYPIECGTVPIVPGTVGDGTVRVTGPGVDCEEALRIIDRYMFDDSLPPPEGSGGFREVERWICGSDNMPSSTGAYIGCDLLDGSDEPSIEMT